MAVFCAKCGEELLGAINRCWRCGTEYESRSGNIDVPPVRRRPIKPVEAAAEALVIDGDEPLIVDGNPSADEAEIQPRGEEEQESQPKTEPQLRRGSPFRQKTDAPQDESPHGTELGAPPRATIYPKHVAASVGSTVAITLGLLSLILGYFVPLAGVIVAGIGIGMGVWGLSSTRRRSAIVGLLLCCLAITFSGFFGAAQVYQMIHGDNAFDAYSYPSP